ncbi:MAG: basic amino acid ABC transporter substrate-binding protein [Bacillaceae bacterium]|nr:basic amino acid ABC transporter substrate-binding protein [Bacillaceae bacterium]
MKRKSFFAMAIILVIALLSACGTGDEGSGDNQNADSGNGDQKEKLIIGTDAAFAPFEYLDKGKIVGFDVDFIDAVMAEAGYDYEIKNVGWDPLFPSVENGDVDFGLSAISITDERLETYDFSVPYFESRLLIMVPEGSDVQSATDLEGLLVGVQNGTTGQVAIEKVLGENNPNIKKYETTAVAIMAMKNGDVDAVVTDNTVAEEYVKNNPNDNFVTIGDPENFVPEYYGLMFKKGSELKAELDEAITKVLDSGKYEEIYQEWFGYEPDVEVLKEAAQQ